ncbi:hypothetical protein [Streptomyces beigongshangae]|uniref:hypothetical protein n=1 Tax=Streptomyces beigongshangae TaxID=2841597 RepID=UPI001C866A45|nr:hypothetical protein [Streptomyces sp. REN17]
MRVSMVCHFDRSTQSSIVAVGSFATATIEVTFASCPSSPRITVRCSFMWARSERNFDSASVLA